MSFTTNALEASLGTICFILIIASGLNILKALSIILTLYNGRQRAYYKYSTSVSECVRLIFKSLMHSWLLFVLAYLTFSNINHSDWKVIFTIMVHGGFIVVSLIYTIDPPDYNEFNIKREYNLKGLTKEKDTELRTSAGLFSILLMCSAVYHLITWNQ